MYCSTLFEASSARLAVSKIMKHLTDKCREDALRHLNPYQCEVCSKRFRKCFTKKCHKRKRNPCVPPVGDRNSKPDFWVSPKLQRAVSELEKAKGYDMVIAAIHECICICGEFFHLMFLKLALDLTWPLMSRPRWGTDTEHPE